jgi:hypothetical protein
LSTALGGNGWFMLMGDEPRDITLEHNTIDSNGNTIINVYGGTSTDPREVYGFQMIANAARHGTYGINGSYFGYGNAIITGFFPGAVFTANYLAEPPPPGIRRALSLPASSRISSRTLRPTSRFARAVR